MKPHGTQLSLFETRTSNDAFAVRVSPRARRLTARVHVGGRVEIVVPVGVGPKLVREFVQRFSPWIDRKVTAMRCVSDAPHSMPSTIDFSLTGEQFEVQWERATPLQLREHNHSVKVIAPDERAARTLLQIWLKQAAHDRLAPRLMALAESLRFPVKRISIRRQRTRWGSCSTRGTVSLNCSLVFQRPDVVKYLFVHELAHTQYMNHSCKFWNLVESIEPNYRRLDRELLAGWRSVPVWVFKN